MRNYELSLEHTRGREAACLMVALGIHGLIVLWNPIMLKSGWQAPHDFVTVDVIEQAPAGVPLPEEKPRKMSLMDTLKDMLMKPKGDELAHVAPSAAPIRTAPAPAQPLLKEVTRPRMITPSFNPQSATEDIAGAKGPDAIQANSNKIAALPLGTPTLKTKAFGGIRAKDLPFQVGADENIAVSAGAGSIPIALGNKSAKGALSYAPPALQDASRRRIGLQNLTDRAGGGIHSGDIAALGTGAPAPIALSGTGGSGTAPTGSAAPSLNQRRGGGGSMVGAALLGQRGGSYLGGGSAAALSAMPSAARELDTQINQMNSSGGKAAKKLSKGFELAGPLNNRPIIRKVIPQYPDWAQEQGVIGSVRLYFTVTSEGKVRPNIQVTKTTGYPQLDQLAIDALKEWQFAPIGSSEEARGEWGIITFNFSLSS